MQYTPQGMLNAPLYYHQALFTYPQGRGAHYLRRQPLLLLPIIQELFSRSPCSLPDPVWHMTGLWELKAAILTP